MSLPPLDPVVHQPTRLRIMGLLYRNRQASFTWVRQQLHLTDGNLASHAAKLEEAGYIRQVRALVGRGFQVRLQITPQGDAAYRQYREALRALLEAPVPDLPTAERSAGAADESRPSPFSGT